MGVFRTSECMSTRAPSSTCAPRVAAARTAGRASWRRGPAHSAREDPTSWHEMMSSHLARQQHEEQVGRLGEETPHALRSRAALIRLFSTHVHPKLLLLHPAAETIRQDRCGEECVEHTSFRTRRRPGPPSFVPVFTKHYCSFTPQRSLTNACWWPVLLLLLLRCTLQEGVASAPLR